MTRSLHRVSFAVLIALMSAAGITACAAPGPDASPSPTAEAVTPTPTAAAPPIVTAVVLRPEHLELVDAAGVIVQELSYDAPTAELVDALTAVFGSDPELDVHPVGYETPQTDIYRWDGFEIHDDLMGHVVGDTPDTWTWYPDDVPDNREMNVFVIATAPAVGEVDIRADHDVRAGDDFETVAAAIGAGPDVVDDLLIEAGPELGPSEFLDFPNAYSVMWHARHNGTTTYTLVAPQNWGGGGV